MRFLENTFDLSQFDEYREDNRREVKKANGGLPTSLWDTYSSFANCYVDLHIHMQVDVQVTGKFMHVRRVRG